MTHARASDDVDQSPAANIPVRPLVLDGEADEPTWAPGRMGQLLAMCALLLAGLGYENAAWQLAAGSADSPGIGMYPRIVGAIFIAATVVVIVKQLTSAGHDAAAGEPIPPPWRPAVVLGVVLGYAILVTTLGHLTAAALVVLVLLRVTGRRPWWQVVVTAVLASIASSVLITTLLSMPLPAGRLGIEL